MDLSKSGVAEDAEDASSDSEVAQFYRPGLYGILLFWWIFLAQYFVYLFLYLYWIARLMCSRYCTVY